MCPFVLALYQAKLKGRSWPIVDVEKLFVGAKI